MDTSAEFTLRLLEASQPPGKRNSLGSSWYFFPALAKASWDEAREILTAAAKPLVVAPLPEPHHIAIWGPDAAPKVTWHINNQLEFTKDKLQRLGLTDTDAIVLGTERGDFTISVPDYMRWLSEYTILARIVLTRTMDPRVGQFLILSPADDPRRPLNPHRPEPPPEAGDCGHPGHGH